MRRRIGQMCYSTKEKYAEKCEELRRVAGRTAALEKQAGEGKKEAYCFLFGKPKKLTPSEVLEFKEAGMKIVYLTEEEVKNK